MLAGCVSQRLIFIMGPVEKRVAFETCECYVFFEVFRNLVSGTILQKLISRVQHALNCVEQISEDMIVEFVFIAFIEMSKMSSTNTCTILLTPTPDSDGRWIRSMRTPQYSAREQWAHIAACHLTFEFDFRLLPQASVCVCIVLLGLVALYASLCQNIIVFKL